MVIGKDLNDEFKKNKEFDIEANRVEEIVNIIKNEIVNYIHKRKNITESLVEARKNAVEDYKDDEDKLVEYFDHERFIKEELYKLIDKKLKECMILQQAPYFGRVDFKEEKFDSVDTIYIGRFGFTEEKSYEPLVIDWRSPVASLFYAGKLGEAKYQSPEGDISVDILSKRQFVIKKEKLQGMFDSYLDVKDEILQMVLSKNTSDKLKDIIMTIQKEQDELIRQPRKKTIVVNGVAGSGKTTIALHRVAYLLYNYRKILQDKVLILGPNSIFMEYISTVLPSLGEIDVRQQTFTQFAMDVLDINEIMSFQDYMEKVINEEKEFTNEMLKKTSKEYIDYLDEYIDKLNKNYFTIEDLTFENKIIYDKETIKELFNYYKSMPLFRRSKKIKRILFSKIKDARDEKIRKIEEWYRKTTANLSEEQRTLNESDLIFKRKLMIRETLNQVIISKKSLQWLDNQDTVELYNELNAAKQLTIDDLAPILYLKIKLEGLKLKEEIKHVVIDEAQDYSMLQFKVIKELTKCQYFTIVGDTNQRMVPCAGVVPMVEVDEILPDVEYFNLDKSYRSTKKIMEYANMYLKDQKLIPLVREGNKVTEKSFSNNKELKIELINTINNLMDNGYESIAVICENLEETYKTADLIKPDINIKVFANEDMIYNKGAIIIPVYFAKGLEFDAVIVVDTMGNINIKQSGENKLMYIRSTRALHELYVYKLN